MASRTHAQDKQVNTMKARKNRCDSVSEMVKSRSNDVIALPDGVEFTTEEELNLWRQYTASRSGWRDFDLIWIAEMVDLKVDVNRIKKILAIEGDIVKNDRGTQIPNPWLTVKESNLRMMLAITSKLSLGVANKEAIAKNKSGKKSESEMLNKMKNEGAASLLAH